MAKRKTHQQFVYDVAQKNNKVTVLGQYINSRTKVLVQCNTCGYTWDGDPDSLMAGHGCPKCAGCAEKTHNEYVEEMLERNPDIEVIGKYDGANRIVQVRCRQCGHIWNGIAARLLHGEQCAECSSTRHKTHTRFVRELNKIAPNLQVLSTYKNNRSKIRVRCSICGNERTVKSGYLLSHPICPQCSKNETIGNKAAVFREYITNNYENIELLEEYVGIVTKIRVRCKICGAEFQLLPHKHIGNNAIPIRCKNCSDGISYPNKFVRAMLNQMPVENLTPEWRPSWSKKGLKSYYFYDNYFAYLGKEYVVEVDGGFHYRDNNMTNQPATVTQEQDREKTEAAIEHGICVIRIDAQHSSSDYLQKSIANSELARMFDLSDIDWRKCERLANKSVMVDICNYYNEHPCQLQDLEQIFHIGRNTISRYLRAGTNLGLCNYVPRTPTT